MSSEAERQRKQRDLDSILDAALDELDDSGSDDEDGDDGHVVAAHHPEDTATAPSPSMGGPYSREYLSSNAYKETIRREDQRPQFGPEPPPIINNNDATNSSNSSSSSIPPPTPPFNLSTGEQEELAASLEGMMKQFTDGLAEASGGAGGDSADAALDEMFKQMMTMNNNMNMGGGDESAMPMPMMPPSPKDEPKDEDVDCTIEIPPTNTNTGNPTQSSTPRKSDTKTNNGKSKSNKQQEPNVDESINRLLDGINQATSTPLPNPNNSNNYNMPPNMPPGMEDMDPNQFEKLGEEMMGSIMGEFNKMGNASDSNHVVDNVMKQLLNKDIMYEPMKQVTNRFPEWLATNKDELSKKDYEKYGNQYQYFQRIVRVYETEPDNFDRLMELMQDIQEFGQPPVEIIKDLAPDLEFDEEGLPVMGAEGMMPGMSMPPIPGMPPFGAAGGAGNEQCTIS